MVSGRSDIVALLTGMSDDTRSTIEAAEMLGVSTNTVRRRIQSGEIPATTEGGYLRIPVAALDAATNQPTTPADLAGDLSDLPGLVDAATAAPLLGMTVDALWYHLRQGHLPSRRFGRRVLIPTAALRAILDGSTT